jgi:hypothetical protein
MRRDVNMGEDCIFDTSIPAYLGRHAHVSEQCVLRCRVEGLAYQVLIHTYDAVLLFGDEC